MPSLPRFSKKWIRNYMAKIQNKGGIEMGILDEIFGNSNNSNSKKWKTKEELDCFYDCKECPYSWECKDDGRYLDDESDYETY